MLPDWLAHWAAYLILGILVAFPVSDGFRLPLTARGIWVVVLLTAAYGLTDEWHQTFVPERVFSLWDWAADSVGGISAAAIIRLGLQVRSNRQAAK